MENITDNKIMEGRMRRPNIYIIRVLEQMNGGETIFKETITENFPKLMVIMNIQIPEAKQFWASSHIFYTYSFGDCLSLFGLQ